MSETPAEPTEPETPDGSETETLDTPEGGEQTADTP